MRTEKLQATTEALRTKEQLEKLQKEMEELRRTIQDKEAARVEPLSPSPPTTSGQIDTENVTRTL